MEKRREMTKVTLWKWCITAREGRMVILEGLKLFLLVSQDNTCLLSPVWMLLVAKKFTNSDRES